MSKTTVTNKFVKAVLAEMNKTEQQKQQESVQEFVDNAVIDCKQNIATIQTSELPKLKLELQKAQNKLTQSEKSFGKAKFSVASTFEQYVENREAALDKVDEAKADIQEIEVKIQNVEKQLATFEEILADLS